MKYKVAKVVGLNSDQQAAQVIVNFDDPDNIFLGLLDLTSDDAFTTGRGLLSDLVDFFVDQPGSAGERLKLTFEKAKELLSSAENFSILLAVVTGKVLYLMGDGKVKCILRRLDKVTPLEASAGQLISGFLQEGDRVFAATDNLVESIGNDLKLTLDLSLDVWEEEMGTRVTLGSLKIEEDPEGDPDLIGGETVPANGRADPPAGRAGLILDAEADSQEEPIKSVGAEEVVAESMGGGLPGQGLKEKLTSLVANLTVPRIPRIFPSRGRTRLVLAVVLILILGAGAGLKYKHSQDLEKQKQFNQYLQAAKDDYSAAQGLHTLNPADATLKIASAKANLDKALNLIPKNNDALALKKQIEENGSAIGQKFDNVSFSEYLDLDLIKKGFRATLMSYSLGKLLLLNSDDATLVTIDVAKKSQKILAGRDKLGEAKLASLNGETAFVFSKDKGILSVDLNNEKASSSAKLDKDWGEIGDLYGFGGNIYLLDKVGNQIWKYLAITGGYSDKRKYLADGVKADLGSALRIQIESSVYVLKSGGQVLRFTRGESDNFSIGGLDKGIKDPKSFFVSSDTDNLYILDSGNSRLVVLTKTGSYVSQYSGDKFGAASDLVVDEKGKKVYLLDGSKIYMTELK